MHKLRAFVIVLKLGLFFIVVVVERQNWWFYFTKLDMQSFSPQDKLTVHIKVTVSPTWWWNFYEVRLVDSCENDKVIKHFNHKFNAVLVGISFFLISVSHFSHSIRVVCFRIFHKTHKLDCWNSMLASNHSPSKFIMKRILLSREALF